MINSGKCPKCESIVSHVATEDVTLNVNLQARWKGFSYSCPRCRTVLGVQMNPLTIQVDIVNDIKKLLGR